MTCVKIQSPSISPSCTGYVLVDDLGLPRYWATIWADVLHASISTNTRKNRLYSIDRLYRHTDHLWGAGSLDRALSNADLPFLEVALSSFVTALRNLAASKEVNNNQTWESALSFVSDLVAHIDALSTKDMAAIQSRQVRLQRLYAQMRPAKPRPPLGVRALPAAVIADLYDIFSPTSSRNPFRPESLRWRNFVIFLLLLHLGLRRGEIGVLPADAFKSEFDYEIGRERHWINIEESPYEDDPRFDIPSIKTATSRRQLPVPEELFSSAEIYITSHRAKASHSYMFSSQKDKPLSLRSLHHIIEVASSQLTPASIASLSARSITRISPHDLRHTCAVYRLSQYAASSGGDIDIATEKLRVFFGWGPGSSMPRHYARSYYEPSQSEIWSENYSRVISMLREVEGKSIV